MLNSEWSTVDSAIESIRQGRMIVLVDAEHRENEGDLVMAAEHVSDAAINFMCQYGRGLICCTLQPEDFNRLQIPMMVQENRSQQCTAFGVSFEATNYHTTGISAADRAAAIKVAINPLATSRDIVMPGHMFPIKARHGGVLVRAGHTEGSADLARLAGLKPAAVICEIMSADGSMARRTELIEFAKMHRLPIITIQQLIDYRLQHEMLLSLAARAGLPLKGLGEFAIQTFDSEYFDTESIALIKEPLPRDKPCLVRIHSECLSSDVFGSERCDCGEQLHAALHQINEQGGILLYLRQEGRGIGLVNKIRAYALQDQGMDTVEANQHLGSAADQRDYDLAAQMLRALDIHEVQLLTNNPHKVVRLEYFGIKVAKRIPLETSPNENNLHYLQTKREKLGHLLHSLPKRELRHSTKRK